MALSPRRALGLLLLGAAYLPIHRLLDPARSGSAGAATRASAEAAWGAGLWGTVIVLVLAVVLARMVPATVLSDRLVGPGRRLLAIPRAPFAAGLGLVTFLLSALVARHLYGGLPTSVDGMVQMLHARAIAAGILALPVARSAAWNVQNGVFTDLGWASVYPPFHTLMLAGGLRLGVPWLVGPAAVGVGTAATAAGLDRLLSNRSHARAAALLVTISPFWLLLGGTYLSHTTAAAAVALLFWAAIRARDGRASWALLLGACAGALVSTRPWTGLVVGGAVGVGVLASGMNSRAGRFSWLGARAGLAALGGAPFAALLFWWNRTLFGSPLRLGYSVAFGPSHGLGFHTDPWGNRYGPLEAFAYTGADLTQLGAHLLETPLPALALVAAALLLTPLPGGARLLLLWAISAVAANAVYWHHGIHMGPRMLFETAPAWAALTGIAAVTLLRAERSGAIASRGVATWTVALMLAGAVWLAPGVTRAARTGDSARASAAPPEVEDGPALVFVHGSWSSRVAARLVSGGMRRDSVETALRRNDLCEVDRFSKAFSSGAETDGTLDFSRRTGSPGRLRATEISPGNVIRVDPTRPPTPACLREAASDRRGVLELEPLLWQLPPGVGGRVVVARDLGPADNAKLLAGDSVRAFLYADLGGGPRLLDYDAGMALLWGGAARPGGPS